VVNGGGSHKRQQRAKDSGRGASNEKFIPVHFMEYIIPRAAKGQNHSIFDISKPVSKKWIYVFRSHGNKIRFYAEIKANIKIDVEKKTIKQLVNYTLVNRGNPEIYRACKRAGKKPRLDVRKRPEWEMSEMRAAPGWENWLPPPTRAQKKEKIKVENLVMLMYEAGGVKVENFFCLSRFPLPLNRITAIKSSLEAADQTRAKRISVYTKSDDSEVADDLSAAIVWLTDYFAVAGAFHKKYINKRDEYLAWVNPKKGKDVTRPSLKYLNDRIHDLCAQNADYWEDLKDDGKVAKKWKADYDREEKKRAKAYSDPSVLLTEWLHTNEFKAVQLDYESGNDDRKQKGEEEYAKVTQRLSECRAGMKYFTEEYNESNSWLRQHAFSTGRKVHGIFWEIVSELATTIINVEEKNAASKFITIIKMRRTKITIEVDEISIGKHSHLRNTQKPKVPFIKITKSKNWAKALEDSKLPGALKKSIELFNFAFAVKTLANSKTGSDVIKNLLGLAGAVVDLGMAVGFLTKRLLKKFGQKLNVVTGIITGVIDAVTGGWDCINKIGEGNYAAAAGYGIAVIGGIASTVGSCMLAAAAVSGGTIVGAPLAAILAIGGLIVGLIGSLIAAFCERSALKEWFMHCKWGVGDNEKGWKVKRHWSEGAFKTWKNDIAKQIRALHNILYDFKIELEHERGGKPIGGVKSGYFTPLNSQINVKITPSLLAAFSKFTIKVWIEGPLKKDIGVDAQRAYIPWKVDLAEEAYKQVSQRFQTCYKVICPRKQKGELVLDRKFVVLKEKTISMKKDESAADNKKRGTEKKITKITVVWIDKKYADRAKNGGPDAPNISKATLDKAFIIPGLHDRIFRQGAKDVFLHCHARLDIYGDEKHLIPTKSWKKAEKLRLK
jgi:hypothetical protein